MFYLVRPDITLEGADVPDGIVEQVLNRCRAGRPELDWQPVPHSLPVVVVLHLALRQGIRCPAGIIIPPAAIRPLIDLMLLVNGTLHDSTNRPGRDLLEVLMLSTPERRQVGVAVDAPGEQQISEAREKLWTALVARMNLSLVEHWRKIGGSLPPVI